MKPIITILAAGLWALAACAPSNQAENVEALAADDTPAERLIAAGLSTSLAPAESFESFGKLEGDRSFHGDILFYETVLSYGPVEDPRPIFLLANAYIVASQQEMGIAFLERLLKRYENHMTDDVHATYLAAYALLRATYAEDVPIPGRIFWVLDTFDFLDQAKELSGGQNPLVRWAAGIIYTQVPSFFGKYDQALAELTWLADHPESEPTPGFYREVYRHLSQLYERGGDTGKAALYLSKSGYEDYAPPTLFMGWFATTKKEGLLFAPTPWIEDVVPGRVFAIRGFGFSDLHFIVSDDGKELISIDAGTQPFSMQAGYEFLRANRKNLPPLTTLLVTHAHWDHIGGYTYLKSLDRDVVIYGRGNYHGTIDRISRNHVYRQFRGVGFQDDWVRDYAPDIVVTETKTINIGGTALELIPVTGGETEDALLIHAPDLDVLFMGDALMPFYGEPWTEEGFIDDAVATMDAVLERAPKHILHGHVGITVIYGDMAQLQAFRDAYSWLVTETRRHISNGYSMEEVRRLNLIPPGLQNQPEALFGYLAPRDSIIARTADHMTGIWRENVTGQEPDGLDSITSVEYGRMLEIYLGLSVGQIESALERMLAGGDLELALQMAVAAEARYPGKPELTRLKEDAANRLRSKAQYFDPFAFVTYTELIGKEHKPIPREQPK